MSDQSQERAPDGDEESTSVQVGEPARESDAERSVREERPDLDERERRIRPQRKPMGPPLEEAEESAEARGPAESSEPPTEPQAEPGS
jgi:hypothetical protein